VQQLFDAFVASPSHYENLIDPGFGFIGVGVVYDGQGRMWTAHRFMAVGETPVTTSPPPQSPAAGTVPTSSAPVSPISTTAPTSAIAASGTTATTFDDPSMPDRLAFRDAAPLNAPAVLAVVATLKVSGI
jgi:hypothetical protein